MRILQGVVVGTAVALGLLATGCTTYTHQARSMTSAWATGNAAVAARAFCEKARQKENSPDAVIWHLEAGAACRAAGSFELSNQNFEIAAARIERYEEQARVKLAREALATFSNQQNLPYEGRPYDKIMLHTYRGLNYLALGDPDKARPEVIRAYQRQQDAVEENKRRIEQARLAEREHEQRVQIERARQDPRFADQLQSITSNLEGFQFYADYVNPFTVYLDGLFFLYAGSGAADLERANKSLRRVAEVVPENRYVQADVAASEALLAGQAALPTNLTYVIFETGRAASREQVRIDIPIIVTDVSYVGAALPRLAFHSDHAPHLKVRAGNVQETTALVANMDSIIALDFKNEFPIIVTKTIIATLAKGAAAYAVNQAVRQQDELAGLFTRIVTAVAQAAVNIADTRSWTTLPKEFQVARLNTPPDRRVALSTPSGVSLDVTLIDGLVNVVYVRSVTANSPLLVNQFRLR